MKKALTTLTALAIATLNLLASDKPVKPNILFILADDTGIDDYGCYGSDRFKGKTPNIDALAKSGLQFQRCYAQPLCGPSRATLMTGRYVFRTGAISNPITHKTSFKDEPSLARTVKKAGYITGMAGKWRQMGDSPGDWGFDEFVTDKTAGGWYWQKDYIKNGQQVDAGKELYCPDVCLEFTKMFFKRHKDEPFYFFFPTHLVHDPILRTPDTKEGTNDPDALYDDNMAYLDRQVGELVAELEKLGLRETTLIVFAGDNGTFKRSGTIGGREIHGAKGSLWEGGSRVPLIANWPGTMPAGQVLNDFIDFTDFFPTFAEVTGATMPAGVTFDGRSFAPRLRGEPGNPRDWVFVQLGANWYVREQGFKLTQKGELFDMSDAPFVEKPVPVGTMTESSRAAFQRLQAILSELNPADGKTDTGPRRPARPQSSRIRTP